MAPRFPLSIAGLAILLYYAALLVDAGSCGTVGGLRNPILIDRFPIPGSNRVALVGKCEQACLDQQGRCRGFAVNMENHNCQLFGEIMERQGMSRSDDFNVLHYDLACFEDTPTSSSTQAALNLTTPDDAYTCVPSNKQGIYNPSFEEGLWVSYAHGWTLHGSMEENKPTRDAGGLATDGDVTMVFDVIGSGSSSLSQTLCVAPALKYELTALVGHKTRVQIEEDIQEIYYHAPTLSIYLDKDLVYRNSICGPESNVAVTECQLDDGAFHRISVLLQPIRSSPNLTFQFDFDAPEGRRSYKGLLDLVELHTAEPPI